MVILKFYMFNLIVLQTHHTSSKNKLILIYTHINSTPTYERAFFHLPVGLPRWTTQTEVCRLSLCPKKKFLVDWNFRKLPHSFYHFFGTFLSKFFITSFARYQREYYWIDIIQFSFSLLRGKRKLWACAGATAHPPDLKQITQVSKTRISLTNPPPPKARILDLVT